MVIPASYDMTVETPREAFEDACERLRRTAMDSGCALDLAEALQELTGLRLLDQLPDFISIKDRRSRFVFANEAVCRAADISDYSSLLGKTDFDVFIGETANRLFAMEQAVMENGTAVDKHEEYLVRHDGKPFWLSISKTALRNSAGQIVGLVSISRDISERKRQEDLRHGHARLLEMIARGQPLDVVLNALVQLVESQLQDVKGAVMLLDEDCRHLSGGAAPGLSPSYVQLIEGMEIGPGRGSCGTAAWLGTSVTVADVQENPLWEQYRELGTLFGFRSCWSTPIIAAEARVLGTFALYSPTTREPTPLELELMAMATDLAGIAIERAESERRIRHLAHHDPLTGLPNRTLFWAQFSRILHEARRENRKVTVAYLDLDNFKSINDTLGHGAGDEVLKTLAGRMSRCIRASDLIVRLGGDEFAIVFSNPDHDQSGVLRRLDTLRNLISEPVTVDGAVVNATCSMGVAFFPEDGEAAEDLLASADHSMYEAKALGRDRLFVSA
ncbi:sensor domain-containing protein [Aliirhizobium smilacinae]|uniref:Diguanylate cyclase n=1 Tax=Aliirhizobium smilacinae TaxID=1395944 RepID=A0A5C4XQV5_9HYPH|nr:diguanylate cyclase [Rhizobium smilacinae]TNM65782.1 diguanylate cyclase [Rhizobium smilacinae]